MTEKKIDKTSAKTKHPPIVVVLGHVDHGKTTLLDYIRKTSVQAGEAGGITQHIGAYQTQVDPKNPNSFITFIDTPGHEAFSKMRSRGSQVADIAILVVAANDGVKPQTKEAIAHIKKAGIPFIVAINKIDLEGINLDVVKAQLAENEIIVEDYGGDIVAIPISAQQGKGVDELLEMINLMWEMQEIKEVDSKLKAVVLESFVDSHKGVIANVLVLSGEIKRCQDLMCEALEAKVRCLFNENGKLLTKATASQPVQILGFKDLLPVGAIVEDLQESKLKQKQQEKDQKGKQKQGNSCEEGQNKIKLILKADVAGVLEAIKANFTQEVDLIGEGLGDISDSDVLLASSTGAKIIAFNVNTPKQVQKLVEMEGVKIKTYNIIYHLLEDLQKEILKLIEPCINEETLGKAEVIAEFNIKGNHIAGCKVVEGEIIRSEKVRILRGEKVVAEPRIGAMQVERQDTAKATKGQEVALVFRPDVKFNLGDLILSYKIVD
ncbi:translation initiation factor IF-2 [Candidatus Beckwithbacteria bacterium]|nr:translation initiation factor IF-2 [Candidatus Beckwithbacteria bacterium]